MVVVVVEGEGEGGGSEVGVCGEADRMRSDRGRCVMGHDDGSRAVLQSPVAPRSRSSRGHLRWVSSCEQLHRVRGARRGGHLLAQVGLDVHQAPLG